MDENNNGKKIIPGNTAAAILLAFAGCLGIIGIIAPGSTAVSGYIGSDEYVRITYTNSFFAVLFWGISLYALLRLLPDFRGALLREKIYSYVFSFLLSVALHMGAKLESVENVNFKDFKMYIFIIMLALYLAPIIYAFGRFTANTAKKYFLSKKNLKIKLLPVWGVIFALWIPAFLAFFPGAFVYDATDEYIQVITRSFSMHHPLLHVLLLGGIVHAFEYIGAGANAGIAAYTLLQMAACSFVAAFVIIRLQKWGASKKYLLGSILVFGLFPIFPMYAVCSAKDTLFTAALLLVTVLLLQYMKNPQEFLRSDTALFVAASVVMMLLRNNGMYAYVAAILVIIVCLLAVREGRKNIMRIAVLMLLSVVLYFGGRFCLKTACRATDNEHQEMLTVPIQQLARVYKYSPETFTEEEKEALYEILPQNYLITYTPRCSDVLKSGFDNAAYEKNPNKYRKLWWSIFKKKPYVYINAWLVNSYGYWYPDMIINVYGGNQMYTFKYENSSYFGFETEPPGQRHSLFPLYERLYRNISLELFQQKVPVVSMLFSPGFMFVVFAFAFMGFMMKKRWKIVGALSPVLLLWGTVLLGPTVLVRYVLIFWCLMPVLPILIHEDTK